MKPDRFSKPVVVLFQMAIVFLVVSGLALTSQFSSAQDNVIFETDIKPLLEQYCIRCHGPDDQEGDFRIDDRETLMSGYVEPGDALFSDLYLYVTSEEENEMMPPPDEGGPLAPKQIVLIKNWIDQGADWPESVTVDLVKEVVEDVEEQVAEQQKVEDSKSGNWTLFSEITGLLHPLVLHFPVALLMGGAFFALLGFRGESPLSDAAYYCLWLGALTAILACVSGWFFAVDKNMPEWQRFDTSQSIDLHRWGGILIAVLASILALIASSSRRRDPYGTGAGWKTGMLLLAVLTGFVAHHGGKMTHDGLHDKLFNKTIQLYENLTGDQEQVPSAATDTVETEQDESKDRSSTEKNDEAPDATNDESGIEEPDVKASGETSDEGKDDNAG